MGAIVLLVQYLVPISGLLGLALSIVTGALAWLGALRLTGAISYTDGERLRQLGRRLPVGVQPILGRCVSLLSTEAAAAPTR